MSAKQVGWILSFIGKKLLILCVASTLIAQAHGVTIEEITPDPATLTFATKVRVSGNPGDRVSISVFVGSTDRVNIPGCGTTLNDSGSGSCNLSLPFLGPVDIVARVRRSPGEDEIDTRRITVNPPVSEFSDNASAILAPYVIHDGGTVNRTLLRLKASCVGGDAYWAFFNPQGQRQMSGQLAIAAGAEFLFDWRAESTAAFSNQLGFILFALDTDQNGILNASDQACLQISNVSQSIQPENTVPFVPVVPLSSNGGLNQAITLSQLIVDDIFLFDLDFAVLDNTDEAINLPYNIAGNNNTQFVLFSELPSAQGNRRLVFDQYDNTGVRSSNSVDLPNSYLAVLDAKGSEFVGPIIFDEGFLNLPISFNSSVLGDKGVFGFSITSFTPSELELCMAIDGSGSIGPTDFERMREELANAVASPAIVPQDGSVKLTVIQFASSAAVEIQPTIIDGQETASELAENIRQIDYDGGGTNIAAAINLCENEFDYNSKRQVIDVVTDGQDNGAASSADEAMSRGVDAINALGIGRVIESALDIFVRPLPASEPPQDGFKIVISNFNTFAQAISDKLRAETGLDITVSSSDPVEVLPVTGTLTEQINTLNAGPPPYVPSQWQPAKRSNDNHDFASFECSSVSDPLALPYLSADSFINDIDEVTYNNCDSAFYRIPFTLPDDFLVLQMTLNVNLDDQGIVFLNGRRISTTMVNRNCEPNPANGGTDPCREQQDFGKDRIDLEGLPVLTWPTQDKVVVREILVNPIFLDGENVLVFGVLGDGSFFEPTGLEFIGRVSGVALNKSPSSIQITGVNPNPSNINQAVSVNYQLDATGNGLSTANITVTASSGETCTTNSSFGSGCLLRFSTGGLKQLTATYAGNRNYTPSVSAVFNHQVNGPGTAGWQFSRRDSDTSDALFGVSCTAPQQCQSVGVDGTIQLSSDGGNTWNLTSFGGPTLNSVDCPSENTCFAVGDSSTAFKTSNGGRSWQMLTVGTSVPFTFDLQDIHCLSDTLCYAVGGLGQLLQTTNGGNTWTNQQITNTVLPNSISCLTANQCFVAGISNGGEVLSNSSGSWVGLPSGTDNNLNAIFCESASTCTVVGSLGTIIKTTNGGTSWTIQNSRTGAELNDIDCPSANNCLVVGSEGTVLITDDGGTTWNQQSPGQLVQARKSLFIEGLNGIDCFSKSACVLVGERGRVVIGSTDGAEISIFSDDFEK